MWRREAHFNGVRIQVKACLLLLVNKSFFQPSQIGPVVFFRCCGKFGLLYVSFDGPLSIGKAHRTKQGRKSRPYSHVPSGFESPCWSSNLRVVVRVDEKMIRSLDIYHLH